MKFNDFLKEKFLHPLFELGVLIKTINGVIETTIGLVILLLSRSKLNGIFFYFARGELLEKPHDAIINFIANIFQSMSTNAKTFAALYILIHGVVNLCLVVGLYKQKLWAYLAVIASMALFISYQIYRIHLYHSGFLIILTVFDVLFIMLTWHEYKYHKLKSQIRS